MGHGIIVCRKVAADHDHNSDSKKGYGEQRSSPPPYQSPAGKGKSANDDNRKK